MFTICLIGLMFFRLLAWFSALFANIVRITNDNYNTSNIPKRWQQSVKNIFNDNSWAVSWVYFIVSINCDPTFGSGLSREPYISLCSLWTKTTACGRACVDQQHLLLLIKSLAPRWTKYVFSVMGFLGRLRKNRNVSD